MFASRAYLHWYERYGTDDEQFKNAFDVIDQVVDSYRDAET